MIRNYDNERKNEKQKTKRNDDDDDDNDLIASYDFNVFYCNDNNNQTMMIDRSTKIRRHQTKQSFFFKSGNKWRK